MTMFVRTAGTISSGNSIAGSDIKMRVDSTTTSAPVEATLEMLIVED